MIKLLFRRLILNLGVIPLWIVNFSSISADETEKEWKVIANPQDLKIENAAIMLLKKAPEPAKKEEKKELTRIKNLVSMAREALKPNDLTTIKQVRSIQISQLGIFKYPFFNCRFKQTDKGIFFEKTAGSQRKSGLVFQDDDRSLVILAASTVNDEPQRTYSGFTMSKNPEHDNPGLIIRRGKTFLAIFPGKNDSFEVHEFR